VTEAGCSAPSLVATIAPSAIGEPVRSVSLQAAWVAATETVPAHCRVDGVFAPVDTAPTARPINFRVILPASWNRRGAQMGGGGNNGIIPNLAGGEFGAGGPSLLQRGFVTYGSDSGHQLPAFGRRGGPPPAPPDQDWALNEEAIRNFGYAQMKKTHDAAMVLIQRMYGERPRFNYYIGTSQGGREALTATTAAAKAGNGEAAHLLAVFIAAGVNTPYARIAVQGSGSAMRIAAQKFRMLADQSSSLQLHMHRHTCRLLKHSAQTSRCNGLHPVEARLARCLLETSDRAGSRELRVTHELLAASMAARRSNVTVAANALRSRKLIEYTRARLRIIDRKGLVKAACGCYGVNALEGQDPVARYD
jgi:CRP-like cAMP-binding protein